MTKKTFDDSDWRDQDKNYTSSKLELELLENVRNHYHNLGY